MENANPQSEENRRFERRLARGLEDVSYLFLSQPADIPSGKAAEEYAQAPQSAPEPAHPRTPILLRSYPAFNRELLTSLLHRNAGCLEEGMHAIDANLPCDPFGAIDILAVDSFDQLSIISIDIASNDESLLRGIAYFDWIVRSIPIIKRMFTGSVINYSAPPRLFLIAPGFSPLLQCAAHRLQSPKVDCFIYRTAAVSGGIGVLFEPA